MILSVYVEMIVYTNIKLPIRGSDAPGEVKLETGIAGVNSSRDKAMSPLIAMPHSDDESVTAIIDSI